MGIDYQISEGIYKRHLAWRGEKELRCSRCGKKISPGDWIHRSGASCFTRRRSGGGKPPGITRFYHRVCFRELFVSV